MFDQRLQHRGRSFNENLALASLKRLVADQPLDEQTDEHGRENTRSRLDSRAAGQGAVALVVLGIVIAVLRRSAVLHAVGFLVAENGVYLAALAAPGGLPAVVEVGVLFDLVIVVAVAAAFTTRIHDEFGTGDTTVLTELHD